MEKFITLIRNRRGTAVLTGLFFVLALSVLVIGLDSPHEYILAYLATSILFIIMVRNWTRIRSFAILLAVSIAGIILVSGIYVEVICRIAMAIWGVDVMLGTPMKIIETVITHAILFFGPAGIVFGVVGAVTLGIMRLAAARERTDAPGTT